MHTRKSIPCLLRVVAALFLAAGSSACTKPGAVDAPPGHASFREIPDEIRDIAGCVLKCYRLADSRPLEEIAASRLLRYGFIEGRSDYHWNGFQAFLPRPIDIIRLDQVLNQWARDKER